MKIEDQVLSIEQMQHLKELGVEVKDTALAWFPPYKYDADGFPSYLFRERDSYSVAFNDGDEAAIPTLTLQEILEMLPKKTIIKDEFNQDTEVLFRSNNQTIWYDELMVCGGMRPVIKKCETLLETAYEMLCWCAEKGYLNNKENETN